MGARRRDVDQHGGRADSRGGPLICHTDICPENVVFRERQAIAIVDFDFDFASPVAAGFSRRLACLVAGYGLARADHEEFVDAIIEAQRMGNAFVRGRVEAGEPGFVA